MQAEQQPAPLWYAPEWRKMLIDLRASHLDRIMRPVPRALYAVAALFQDRSEARGEALAEKMGVIRRVSSEWPGTVPSWPPGFNSLVMRIEERALQLLGERLTNDLSGIAELIEESLAQAEREVG